MTTKAARDTADHRSIEEALTYVSLFERGDVLCPDPSYFDGAILGRRDLFAEVLARSGDVRGNARIDEIASRLGHIRGSAVLGPDTTNAGEMFNLVAAHQLDVVAKQRVLGLLGGRSLGGVRIDPGSRFVEVRSVSVDEAGKGVLTHREILYEARGRWHLGILTKGDPAGAAVGSVGFGVAVLQLHLARSEWSVRVRFAPGVPSISLLTDPVGVRDFFRFRDIAPGKSRRDTLAHWVTQHWRRKRDDPDAETYVREHMRGRRDFTWHGLRVEIVLPETDVARDTLAAERRKRMTLEEAIRRRARR